MTKPRCSCTKRYAAGCREGRAVRGRPSATRPGAAQRRNRSAAATGGVAGARSDGPIAACRGEAAESFAQPPGQAPLPRAPSRRGPPRPGQSRRAGNPTGRQLEPPSGAETPVASEVGEASQVARQGPRPVAGLANEAMVPPLGRKGETMRARPNEACRGRAWARPVEWLALPSSRCGSEARSGSKR